MNEPTDHANLDGPLPRRFGFWTGLFVVVASMVGTGVLTTSGYTLKATGSQSALLLLWLLGGVIAVCGAVTLTELATTMPRVGGNYIYVREAFGPAVAFVFGWSTLLFGFAAPIALVAQAAVDYLRKPWQQAQEPPLWATDATFGTIAASVVLAVFTIAHCLGHRQSSWTQVTTTAFKFLTLVCLAVLGLTIGGGDWSYWEQRRPLIEQQPAALAQSLLYVIYSYAGWEAAVYLGGEIRDPQRLLPRCMIGGCLIVTLLYLALNLTYTFALDLNDLASMELEQVRPIAALAAARLFGAEIADPFAFLVGLGILASLSAFLLAGARVAFAMARDGILPGFAGQVHATTGVPTPATLALGVASIALLWTGTFEQLIDFTTFGLFLVMGLVVACIFALRDHDAKPGVYRIPLYPLPPIVYLVLTGWAGAQEVVQNPVRNLGCLACMAAGLPIYWLIRRSGISAKRAD